MNSVAEVVSLPRDFLALEPAQVAMLALAHIRSLPPPARMTVLGNRSLFTNSTFFTDAYDPAYRSIIHDVLVQAWSWLERNEYVIPSRPEGCFKVTAKGAAALLDSGPLLPAFRAFSLRKELLHATVAERAFPHYRRGDYARAIFEAFKWVEIGVRDAAGLPDNCVGIKLIGAAFSKEKGILTDFARIEAERDARYYLFAGALGAYKNPHSHREVESDDPQEAAELLVFASHLLRIVDECRARLSRNVATAGQG